VCRCGMESYFDHGSNMHVIKIGLNLYHDRYIVCDKYIFKRVARNNNVFKCPTFLVLDGISAERNC